MRINIVDLRVLAPAEWMRRRNMLPSCMLPNGCIGREHVIELQSGGWVHGRNMLWNWWLGEYVTELKTGEWVHGRNVMELVAGGTCYRVEDWRVDVSTE